MDDSQTYVVEDLQVPQFIDEDLLCWLFEEHEFQQWHSNGRSWQLRIVGKPGTGKTVLSTLAVRHLRDKFKNQKQVRVASLFFVRPIDLEQTLSLVLLTSLLRQLSPDIDNASSLSTKSTAQTSPANDDDGCESDLHDLRRSVYQAISQLGRVYLVLDDIDLCYGDAANALEEELLKLKEHGVSVMITSRLPHLIHTYSGLDALCNNEQKHEFNSPIRVWWACEKCFSWSGPSGDISCQSCKDDGFFCKTCRHDTRWHEPYAHIDRTLSIPTQKIRQFVARELESHHGDLGLGSQLDDMPPLSKFGRALMDPETRFSASDLLENIMNRTEDVVAIVRLRLEAANAMETVSEAIRLHDRLPTTLVALFNTAIDRVMKQPREQAELGMAAIVRVSTDLAGAPAEMVQQALRREAMMQSSLPIAPNFPIDEILRVANGLLIVDTRYHDTMYPFHASLATYVQEDYNEDVSRAKSAMQIGVFTRSATLAMARDSTKAQQELATRWKQEPKAIKDGWNRTVATRSLEFRLSSVRSWKSRPLLSDRGATYPPPKDTTPTEAGPKFKGRTTGQFRLARRTTAWQ